MEEKLERWKCALERREMKLSCKCVNERNSSGMVRLWRDKKKAEDFQIFRVMSVEKR